MALFTAIIFIFISMPAFSQENTKQETIIKKKPVLTPYQIISGDTLRLPDSLKTPAVLPGASREEYLEMQDSNYIRAMRLNIIGEVRFRSDYIAFSKEREVMQGMIEGSPMEIIKKNMDIPREFYAPSGEELVHRQLVYENAFYVPYLNTYNPNSGLVSFGQIAQFLGLSEDVSPVLTYTLDHPAEVEIVIYSIQAKVAAVLYRGIQSEGTHSITWNFRNDSGKRMPKGDYIGEIRIGKDRFIRKRIVIP